MLPVAKIMFRPANHLICAQVWVCIDEKTVSVKSKKKKNVIEIVHILSLHSLLFSLPFFVTVFRSNCCCWFISFAQVFLVISLITDTKWFIKISLCTRYACLRSDSWDTHAKNLCIQRAWKITFAVAFSTCRTTGEQNAFAGWCFAVVVIVVVCVWCCESGDELIGQSNR